MTANEKFKNLKERLHTLKSKYVISDNQDLSLAETILEQVKGFMEMEIPPEVDGNLLIVQGLETAEKFIKRAEGKSS